MIAVLPILSINASTLWINLWAFHAVNDIASPILNTVMILLGESFLVVLPVLGLYMLFKRDMNVYTFVIAGILLFVVSDTIKMIVREPRPCNVSALSWINNPVCEPSFSFPSNHASVLTGLTFFMGNYKYVRILYIVWLVLILFGRVYLGVHYFTDVLAGVGLSLAVAYVIYRYRKPINALADKIVGRIINLHLVQK